MVRSWIHQQIKRTMPKKIQKTLQRCLSKIKSPPPQIQLPLSSSKKLIVTGCKHLPRTPSFAVDVRSSNNVNNHKDDAATLADVDRFLFENFKSLFPDEKETTNNDNNNTKRVNINGQGHDDPTDEDQQGRPKLGPILFDSPRFMEPPRDLCGSNRFFVKPSFSGSLVDSIITTTTCDDAGTSSSTTSRWSTTTTMNNDDSSPNANSSAKETIFNIHQTCTLPDDCIAVVKYSPTPHEDFKRSMQDVVEARLRYNGRVDWDFMEEILFSYLNLNDKKSRKFILSAFVDLVHFIRRNQQPAPPRKPRSVRTVRIGTEVRKKKKTQELTFKFGSS